MVPGAIGVGGSGRNGYGNEWYESKHVETSDLHPVSLPAAGDGTEFAVQAGGCQSRVCP